MTNRVPDLILERYALGELSSTRMEETRKRLEAEPGGMDRLAALKASNIEILDKYPERWFGGVIANRMWRNQSRNRAMMATLPVFALAAAAIFASMPETELVNPEFGEDIYTKGDARLEIWRQEKGGQNRLDGEDSIAEGDLLQLRYVPNGTHYGAIFSVDGSGEVTRHLPIRGQQAVPLKREATKLPRSYELDDAPDYETFYIVTGSEAFGLDGVESALDEGTALPDSLKAWSVTLSKEQR